MDCSEMNWAAEWLATRPLRIALFTLPGVSILNFMCDLMHNKHLGVDRYYFGSVLFILCYMLLPNSAAANLAEVMGKIRAHRLGSRTFRRLKLSMFCDLGHPFNSDPRLKGQAGELRHFGRVLIDVWSSYMDVNDFLHRSIRLGLKHSVRMEDILDENKGALVLPIACLT